MKGENGVPETPDWVPPKPKPEPVVELTIGPNIVLGAE